MRVGVVKSSELGTACWSAKVLTNCVGCDKYGICKYPDRRHDPEFDALIADSKEKHDAWLEAQEKIKKYSVNN